MSSTIQRRGKNPGVCIRCSGPCRTFKGAVHGWTCAPCLQAYLRQQIGGDAA